MSVFTTNIPFVYDFIQVLYGTCTYVRIAARDAGFSFPRKGFYANAAAFFKLKDEFGNGIVFPRIEAADFLRAFV